VANIPFSAWTAAQAATEIARGAVTAQDYTRACLDRIAEVEPEVQAFAHLDPDHAMAQAKVLDERKAQGAALGPLHGVPVAIKDIIDTSDFPTECGSPFLSGRRPYHDAHVVKRLREAGAVIIGKTVTTEFAYFHPGKTRNPHDTGRTPGGSSSGSAAAVATGMVPLALGTQTNGSVIRPAAFCGVFGLKPSKGLISRYGVLPLSPTLDTVGPFARTLEDIALMTGVIAGYDPGDPETRPFAVSNFRAVATEKFPIEPRVAFVRTPVWDKADAQTRDAFERLADSLGDGCVRIDLPDRYAEAWDVHRTVMLAEMAYRLGRVVDRGGDAISDVLRKLVEEGRTIGAVAYQQAVEDAKNFASALGEYLEDCNAIITPATTGVAPKGLDATGNPVFCTLWTLSGLPSLSLPLLTGEDDLPLGVQLVGAPHDDARLMRTANWLIGKVAPKGRRKKS
jgi:Asp-tRNA(Asn)/Glu-tRNA(Gln) amidotransferase A subunit family amidase